MNAIQERPWLVRWKPSGIKSYIFQTAKLKEIRGASTSLENLMGASTRKRIQDCGGEPVFLGGGGGLALFPNASQGAVFQRKIQQAYAEEVPELFFKTGALPVGDDLNASWLELDRKLELLPPVWSARHQLGPVTELCGSCRKEPAVKSEHEVLLCHTCDTKRRRLGELRDMDSLFLKAFSKPEWGSDLRAKLATELSQIGDETTVRKGYVALVNCDGNNFGRIFSTRRKGISQATVKNYFEFSNMVGESFAKAIAQATERTWPKGPRTVLPADPHYQGGDDALIICAADRALEFCAHLAKAFDELIQDKEMCLSFGVVFAKHNTPIRAMMDLAEDLNESAKRRYYKEKSGATIDFQVMYGAGVDLETARGPRRLETCEEKTKERKAHREESAQLTGKPYNMAELTLLQKVLKKIRKLSRGRLFDLVEACQRSRNEGTLTIYRLLGRMNPDESQQLIQALTDTGEPGLNSELAHLPWIHNSRKHNSRGQVFTILPDLVELLPFVGGGDD